MRLLAANRGEGRSDAPEYPELPARACCLRRRDRCPIRMDILSGVLKSIRLEGAVFLDAEFTAPWCMRGKYGMASVKQQLAGAEHVVLFHFLTQGVCRVRLAEGGEVIEVRAGDLILFPQDDRHLMGSDLHLAPLEADNLIDAATAVASNPDFVPIRHGGGGAITHFVCGYLACSRSLCRPLFEALPRVLRIPLGDGQASALLRELLRVGVRESSAPRPGAQSTLAKLAELMFVEALRRYVETLPPEGRGWLAALRDVQIGQALALLHDAPERAWTVDELAREVAMSRSSLATRFASLVGESPMQYLMRWRLAVAARALRSGSDAISRVAERSGYETEAAFSRAFKREFGLPPSAWRKVIV
jgi:AraC family transcriptional regulator, alkane utilization regulator